MIRKWSAEENISANPNLIPMGYFGSVDNVASVAAVLAINDYMTGHDFGQQW
jgi:hypothetical protein